MFHSKKPDPAVFTWQAQGSPAASSNAVRASKATLPGHGRLGHSLYRVRAPQPTQHISFHTDNTTTTTKSEDGHYARTDYAGTVPILCESQFTGTV